jgi:hypothetical protein
VGFSVFLAFFLLSNRTGCMLHSFRRYFTVCSISLRYLLFSAVAYALYIFPPLRIPAKFFFSCYLFLTPPEFTVLLGSNLCFIIYYAFLFWKLIAFTRLWRLSTGQALFEQSKKFICTTNNYTAICKMLYFSI